MTELKVILRRLCEGASVNSISKELRLSRTSIDVYRKRLEASGLSSEEALSLDEAGVCSLLCRKDGGRGSDSAKAEFLSSKLETYIKALSGRHVTYQRVYEIYCDDAGADHYGYTQFKEKLHDYEKAHNLSFHNVFTPGEVMEVDFAGDTYWIEDPVTKERTKVYVLTCVLPATQATYYTGMKVCCMENVLYGMSLALEFYGGVPRMVRLDNMKQAVKRYDRYEPKYTEACLQWAEHYGTEVVNCRLRKPRDKASVESAVNQGYRYIYAKMELGGPGHTPEVFHSLEEFNQRLYELNGEYIEKPMQASGVSRIDRFLTEEADALNPLPPRRFSYKRSKEIVLGSSYHVIVDGHKYSVPYAYCNKKLTIVWDHTDLEVWCAHERIASHNYKSDPGYTTLDEHMPANHLAYKRSRQHNAAYFLDKAALVGPNTREVIDAILKKHKFVYQAYRTCEGIIGLAAKYDAARMENACARIQMKQAASYTMIKEILEKGLDKVQPQDANEPYMPHNDDTRGPDAF